MGEGLRQYAYISTASGLSEEDIRDLVSVSQEKNSERGITGFLLYNGRNFLQLIEGSDKALSKLLGELLVDPRHSGIVILADEILRERCCPDWEMRWIPLTADIDARRAALSGALPAGLKANVRELILNFAALN